MNDCIKREDAIEAIASADETNGTVKVFTGREVNGILSEIPTADVRENVKGEWRSIMVEYSRENYDQVFCCSVCGVSNDWRRTNFCPHCGADMRGEQT